MTGSVSKGRQRIQQNGQKEIQIQKGWWNTMGMRETFERAGAGGRKGREIIITQTNKKDGKAIKEERCKRDHESRKKGMIFTVAFGGLCISSNITGRKF